MIDRRRFLQAAGAGLALPTLSACSDVERIRVAGVPASGFDDEATAEQVTEGIDLAGKTALVTGCTTGIGFETMRVLAKRGALVVGTSRSLDRAREACRNVNGTTMPVQLDLGDFDSVARCADLVKTLQVPVDMLILNAGYRGGGNDRELINGIEKHFVINHLGHFILTNRLMSRLYTAWQGRVVVVASRSAYRDAPASGIQFDDLAMERDYSDSLAYGQSKLANVLFSLKLADLLRGTRITSNALHPGVINTDIDRNLSAVTRFLFGIYTGIAGKTLEQGAATSCYVATSSQLGNVSGRYFEDCEAIAVEGQGHMQDTLMAERLLEKSIELTADWLVPFEEPRRTGGAG
ncbi:MAG: SDR family NAD(P)-dependent oxidoreductase [Gammaproteobacteria bacterium]|nr:SDR family NAD(P)-dependent oxidoreductase [Gammaproteobacteria bacterium]MBT8105785.1 SDR family NAD(P)-dependent oxidoreductase [Gammaproteobacteria bacterium]NNF48981.1 SDR family NAD(P)-dependent oxidoreductase [Woeseiaceae bacterium]NNK25799.1 SDR family NAD(P)-dependent oxidoreductase [Woeseiaceae bacterium]